jgi:hypothetical protein
MAAEPPATHALPAARAGPYRVVFGLAALYNAALGTWALRWPSAFFDVFGLAPPTHPAIWRCLGMVLGLYGILYAYAAVRLDRARPIVAVGLLGKVLGPIGWAIAVRDGEWPLRTLTLIFLDDVVWWLPFGLFLLEGTRLRERLSPLAPHACLVVNGIAALGTLLVLRPGTEVEPDPAAREAYVRSHLFAWRFVWACWLASASFLVAFLGWWGARTPRRGLAVAGFACAAFGVLFDATAESIFIGWYPDRMDLAPLGNLLTGAFANGLYCVGGVLVTLASGPLLVGWRRTWAYATWVLGFGLTVAAVLESVPLLVAFTAATMISFLGWVAVVGRRLG